MKCLNFIVLKFSKLSVLSTNSENKRVHPQFNFDKFHIHGFIKEQERSN